MAKSTGISSICSTFSSLTCIHRVPHLISAKSIKLRIFWSVVCLASSATFLYLLSDLIEKYYSYPVIIKIHKVGLPIIPSILKGTMQITGSGKSMNVYAQRFHTFNSFLYRCGNCKTAICVICLLLLLLLLLLFLFLLLLLLLLVLWQWNPLAMFHQTIFPSLNWIYQALSILCFCRKHMLNFLCEFALV